MGRAPCCDKVGVKKGPWTAEEDRKLVAFVEEHGHGSWRSLPKRARLLRCGKSCRLRWTNYLRPDIKRGKFSPAEEQTIIQVHALLGNRWSAISSLLPKRTDNEIKNYWNTHLKKKLLKMGIDPVTHRPNSDVQSFINTSSAALSHMAQWESARLEAEARLAREAKFRSKALCSSNATNSKPDGATEALDVKQQWEKSLRLLGLGCGEVSSLCTSFSNDQIGPKSPTSTLCNFDMHHTLQPHGKLSWIDEISEIEQLLQGERTYTSANIQSSEILTMSSSIRTSGAGLKQASEDIGTRNEDSPDASYPGFLSESSSQDADTWKLDSPVLPAAVSTCNFTLPQSSSQDVDTWKKDSHVLPAALSTSDFTDPLLNEVDLISEDIVSNRSLCSTPECDEILSPLLVDLPHDSGFQLDIAEPQPDLSLLLSDNRMEKQGADYWENMINQLTDSCLTVSPSFCKI